MPAYKARFLSKAIESILCQTYQDWELVIVDDHSPENLENIVKGYQDERIHYYRNEKNLGGDNLVYQWNHCLSLAKGDWIVLAADDDTYAPTFCEECLHLANKYPQVNLIRSRVLQIDENDKPLWEDGSFSEFSDKYQFYCDWVTAKAFTCIGNYAFKRSSLQSIGGFIDFPCAFGSDVATPIALSRNGVCNTADMLFRFRQSSVHLSSDTNRYMEKLAGITQLSGFLLALDYDCPEPGNPYHMLHSEKYLHAKCIYDYFNLVIKFLPLSKLRKYLSACSYATRADKFLMILRWGKRQLLDKNQI